MPRKKKKMEKRLQKKWQTALTGRAWFFLFWSESACVLPTTPCDRLYLAGTSTGLTFQVCSVVFAMK